MDLPNKPKQADLPNIKAPQTPLPEEFADSINEYVSNFTVKLSFIFGQVYTPEFKEFNKWCEANLGTKYKDWFLVGGGGVRNTKYTLYLKNSKRSTFLALKYSEHIDRTG